MKTESNESSETQMGGDNRLEKNCEKNSRKISQLTVLSDEKIVFLTNILTNSERNSEKRNWRPISVTELGNFIRFGYIVKGQKKLLEPKLSPK